MTVKLLTEHNLEFLSLTEGCTGSSESTHVKMPHTWKSHVVAYMSHLFNSSLNISKLLFFLASSFFFFIAGESSRSLSLFASFTDWNVDASSASFDFGLYIRLLSPLFAAEKKLYISLNVIMQRCQ